MGLTGLGQALDQGAEPLRPLGVGEEVKGRVSCARVAGSGDLSQGAFDVVVRPPDFDVVVEQRPVRGGLGLVRRSEAAGVDDADAVDGAVELQVRVAADDDVLVDYREELAQPLVGGG